MKYLRSIKLIFALLLLIFGVFFLIIGEYTNAVYVLVGSAIAFLAQLFFADVIVAYKQLGMRRYDKAKKYLDATLTPSLLLKMHRSYYYLSMSILASKEEKYEESERHLNMASQAGGLRERDSVMAFVNLCHLYLSRKEIEKAKKYLSEAKNIECKDLRVKHEIEKLDKVLGS